MNAASNTDTFLNLFLSFAQNSPLTVLSAFFLSMARLFPIMVIAPFFGAKTVPGTIRIMFSIAIISILFPQILFSITGDIYFDIKFVGFFLKEMAIGFVLGFLVTIPFFIAQSSGSLIDFMRGAQSLQVTDPTTSTQTGPVGIFYNYVLIVVFFSIGGPFLFIDALGKSFHLIPVDKLFNPIFFTMSIPFWKLLVGLLNYVLSMAIQLAAPALIGILMMEMFLGIANRMAPQVQIVFLGIPLKTWVGLAMLAVAWYYIMRQLGKEAEIWLKVIENAIQQAAPK
jgi:type III secretion protein SpaR/YscT/HrcT